MNSECVLPIETAFGTWFLACDEQGVTHVSAAALPDARPAPDNPLLCDAAAQLSAYFNGRRDRFCVPLHIEGTPFQKAVFEAIASIPYGETRTYSDVAAQIGRPQSARAVGNACGQNPLLILIPRHRVTAVSGLGGFAGGESMKRALLQLEARYAADFAE